jgi:hypothetical protein
VTVLPWPLHLAEAGLLFKIFISFSSQKKKLGGPLFQPVIVCRYLINPGNDV